MIQRLWLLNDGAGKYLTGLFSRFCFYNTKEHCRNKLSTKAIIIFAPDKAKNLRIVALRKDFLTQSGVKRISPPAGEVGLTG